MIIPSQDGMFGHMPYLHDAGGSVEMLFCLSDSIIDDGVFQKYRPWRIYSYSLSSGEIKRVKTESLSTDVEASPVCYYRDGLFTLSFIIGRWELRNGIYDYTDLHLYKMTGKSLVEIGGLGKMELVVPFNVTAGFEWYGKAVFSIGDGRIMHDNIDGVGRYETDTGLKIITRMVPKHDYTTTVLVTGFKNYYDMTTLLYNLETRQIMGEVKDPNGNDVYKPSLFENMMAHVVLKGDPNREEYKIELLKDIDQLPSN
jgi:hypothetical protein